MNLVWILTVYVVTPLQVRVCKYGEIYEVKRPSRFIIPSLFPKIDSIPEEQRSAVKRELEQAFARDLGEKITTVNVKVRDL